MKAGQSVAPDRRMPRADAINTYGRTISLVMGWPPIPGRLAMLLMMFGEPLAIPEIRDALTASAGSVSEATRLLVSAGVIERIKTPGIRQRQFRWRDDAWVACIRHQAELVASIKQVAMTATMDPHLSPAQHRRFDRMLAFYSLLSDAMDDVAVAVAADFSARRALRG